MNNYDGAFFMDDSYLSNQIHSENSINEKSLENAGFVKSNSEIDLIMEKECPGYKSYSKSINNKYYIDAIFGISNINNETHWNIHIDNCDRQTIGSCDIVSIKQFNDFMKIFNIDCKLS